jgi:transcriptional regulator with XRE-family HTH domain
MKYKNTARFLKQAREVAGISQADIAERLGLEAQSISNIERGLTGVPRKYVFKVCEILKIKNTDLVDVMLLDIRSKYL